ncbi:MAG: ABC transporter substrate-binding protein [Xanthobacteraceae bacterium]
MSAFGHKADIGRDAFAVLQRSVHSLGYGLGLEGKAMRRRDFVTLIGGAMGWPLAAGAQQQATPVLGYLSGGSPDAYSRVTAAFLQGLKEAGYVERQNVAIEYRWAEDHYDRLPVLAADLVRRQVAVIATVDTASSLAAKAATAQIPIVFSMGADPVKIGLVNNLARPGGNVTGMSHLVNALSSKRLSLLRELVPTARTFGLLVDPTNPNTEFETADMKAAVDLLGYKLVVGSASTASEVDTAFTKLVEQRIDALAVAADAFFIRAGQQLAALALHHRVPAIYAFREDTLAGGLISYGGSFTEAYYQAGIYTGRVLKGDKPADLPVQTPTKFELVINLRTANALGLKIPPGVLAIADEVIN